MSRPVHITVVSVPGDPTSARVTGALVQLSGAPTHPDWNGTLLERPDGSGDYYFDTWGDDITPVLLTIEAIGFQKFAFTYPIPALGPWSNIIGLVKENGPHLEIRGADFVDATGQPACYSGVDQFWAFRMFLDGRLAELEALVAESHEFGFQWWRCFLMGAKSQNLVCDLSPAEPTYYSQVRPFADWLNAHGIGLLATIFVDNQVVGADVPTHWQRMADLLRGSTTILDGGNEWDHPNGFDPQILTDPGMIWSRGSGDADVYVPQNGASAVDFHQRTDYPATYNDAVASAVTIKGWGGRILMMTEPTRFNPDGTNKSWLPDSPRVAFQLARMYSANWSLVVFHNTNGELMQPMSPAVRLAAAQWQRGLAS